MGTGAAKLAAPTSRGEETGRKSEQNGDRAACSSGVARRIAISAPVTDDSSSEPRQVRHERRCEETGTVHAQGGRGLQVERWRGEGRHGGSFNQ